MSDSLPGLIEHIYEAALDDEALRRLPAAFAALVDARSCTLQHHHPDGQFELLAFNHFGPELQAKYIADFAMDDDWAKMLMVHGQEQVRALDRYLSLDEFRRTRLHNEFARPNGLAEVSHCLGTIVTLPGAGIGICGIQRDARGGAFDAADEQRMQHIVPHFKRLMQLRLRLAQAERSAANADAMFDHLPVGVLLLSDDAEVLYANAAARSLLHKGDGLCWSMARYLGAEN
ncbi:MAG TPA: PAS domain-containing protein, partial [Solimonas sp.]|nr:PAS domain-containing protein [Solimonas sp.]